MDAKVVAQLRRNQSLRALPDGREGVDVTLQFMGTVPAVPRPARKDWLEKHFSTIQEQFAKKVDVKPGSLSLSAQTVEAIVPVDEFDDLREELRHENVRLAVNAPVQVLNSRTR